MTVIRPNSISGITSLTAHRGSIDFYAHDGSAATFTNINSNVTSGVSTFASLNITGDLDVGGALTYEDVTNVDSIGVVTARNGIDVTGGTVNITNFNGVGFIMSGSGDPTFQISDTDGTNQYVQLAHNGGDSYILTRNNTSHGGFRVYSHDGSSTLTRLRITSDGDMGLGTPSPNHYNNYTTLTLNGSYGGELDFESGGTLVADAFANSGGYYFTTRTAIPIRFHTTNSGGAHAERLRIQPSGYVGIGEDAPGGKLTVKHANTATSGLNATLKLKQGVATNGNRSSLIFSSLDDFDVAAVNGVVEVHSGTSANNVGRLEFWTKASGSDAAERLRITSGGDLFVAGTGGMNTTQLPNGSTINVNGTSSNDGLSVIRYSTGYGAYGLNIGRSKSDTIGTNAAVTNGNDLGHISFYGADGTDFNMAAQITSQVDGTPSDGTDMPGRLVFKTSSDGSASPTERLRITADGKIGINASSGWNSYGDVLLVQGDTGATTKCMISVRGGATGYVHSALKLSATTHSNGSGGNQRGLGVFMHDESSNVEWYAGRPYAQSDYFLIARNTAVNAANAGGVTAQHSMRKWQVDSSGRTVQTGGIYTYQPGQGGGAKSSRALEAKGASGTYSSCVVDVEQNSYGSVAWDIKVGGYSTRHMHVAGTYYCNGGLYANYTSINNSANVTYTRAFVSGQKVRHTFGGSFVHPICEVTATVGGDGYFDPGDITITWA